MVLDDIARRPDAVVISCAASQTDVLGHGDLHMVDEVRVPDGVKQLVGEPQRQDVLHRLLAEVVVDAEDRLLGENLVDHRIELAGAGQIVAEGLLDHHAPPRAVHGLRQARFGQLLADGGEGIRRNRQIETVIAAGATFLIEGLQRLLELLEGRVVIETALHEPDSLGKAIPHMLTKRRA